MEATAHSHHRQMIKLARDAKDTSWEVVSSTKARLEQFRRTMPLIAHLRNPAMRERHWSQIKQQVQGPFEQDADAFTLEVIVELGLDRHAEVVALISASATRELAIEQALEAVAKTWDTAVLDIGQYKDKGHYRLRYVPFNLPARQ
ncbi:dynein axonemal heavy chain 2-like [Petromyzon marinus]|uniref:dynein axonemal heavy chain 2-like n=1 Tax=Petromyzon marinus TaxID=7757 RepID=UPI003F702FCD